MSPDPLMLIFASIGIFVTIVAVSLLICWAIVKAINS